MYENTLKKLVVAAIVCVTIHLSGTFATAGVIGINYVGVGGGSLAAGESAGYLVVDDNWNNLVGVGQGPPATPVNDLNDGDGSATTLDVVSWTLSANNSWTVGHDGTPQSKLNADFSDQQPSITLAQIPYASYSVVVHYNNNEGPSTSTLTLTGSVDDAAARSVQTGNTAATRWDNVGYIEETGSLLGPTNVTVFTGFNDTGLTIALTGANNNGISAIQIVDTTPVVPAPAALPAGLMLLTLGAARRRRR